MKRKFKRMIFHSAKFFITKLVYVNSRLYMQLYNKLLAMFGINFKGEPRFIAKSVKFDDFDLITLGNRLVVSSNVIFLTHDYSYTTALIAINEKPKTDIGILRPIIVGKNVFIGMNSLILPGTIIGNNVIIGAGSVVRGNVPDNSVVSGNPAIKINDIQTHLAKLKDKEYQQVIDKK